MCVCACICICMCSRATCLFCSVVASLSACYICLQTNRAYPAFRTRATDLLCYAYITSQRLQKINPLCDEPLSHASTQCTKNRGWGHLRMVVVTALCPYKGFDCVAAYDAVIICVVCMPDVQVWHAHQALGASMRHMHIMLSAHHWFAEQLVKPCI